MSKISANVTQEHLTFFITGPGESDILFTAVTISLVLVIIGFGALYFTIQSIPDRLAEGTSKTQMQIVGILGLISLITMNNIYWIAALLLGAMRLPDLVTPFKSISRSLEKQSASNWQKPLAEQSPVEQPARNQPLEVEQPSPVMEETAGQEEVSDA
jgi:Sec-independent protein translocase protein TatA